MLKGTLRGFGLDSEGHKRARAGALPPALRLRAHVPIADVGADPSHWKSFEQGAESTTPYQFASALADNCRAVLASGSVR